MIVQNTLTLGHCHGLSRLLESLLLFVASSFLEHSHSALLYQTSVGTRLQNGIVSARSGAVIRTTRVTGIFTEPGIYMGHLLRRLPADMLRLRVVVTRGLSWWAARPQPCCCSGCRNAPG